LPPEAWCSTGPGISRITQEWMLPGLSGNISQNPVHFTIRIHRESGEFLYGSIPEEVTRRTGSGQILAGRDLKPGEIFKKDIYQGIRTIL
jgi:hypothetical protein